MAATVRAGWPTFDAWQLRHAFTHDPERAHRLLTRWHHRQAATIGRALVPAFRALADATQRAGAAFAKLTDLFTKEP